MIKDSSVPGQQQRLEAKYIQPAGGPRDVDYEKVEESVPDRLEAFVRKYPHRVAFKTMCTKLTWEELNRAANRVARAILETCNCREKPVALLFDQEAAMMPAALGVLKAGCFYVLLSPSHPRARNTYILNETGACIIVTNSGSVPLAEEMAHGQLDLLNIDEIDSSLSSENLGQRILPGSLAFLTYTSGSTGAPKGVVNTHQKVLYRIKHDKHFGFGPGDRFTHAGSSAGSRNPFGALLSGAGTFPWYVNEDGVEHLADWLIQEEITVYRSSPRIFRQFVSALTGKEEFSKLRAIVLADEPVYKIDFELYKKHFSSDCLLVNSYGVHEVGPIRMYVIGKATEIAGKRVPIGYEIADREVLVLDDNRQEVGFDQVGEIAVRTHDISPSLWRRPDLRESKFVPDPNGEDRTVYLTGDLGCMSPDGCLEHLGRKDFQVKIRGLRVEIAEVEEALRSMDAIGETVVSVREDDEGEKSLVAYIVAAGNAPLSVSEVRRFVEQKLPPLMVPSRFVVLDVLPLTPTGKVDRRALPAPGKSRPNLDTPFVGPSTPVEKKVSEIWGEVLSLDQVGIHDNFIELGGHSLAATRVVSQVMRAFHVEIPLRSFFAAPTVAEMAGLIETHQAKKAGEADLDRLLAELESLSDEEARRLIAAESGK